MPVAQPIVPEIDHEKTRNFSLAQVLSVTTGYMIHSVCMSDLYDIINYLCQDSYYTVSLVMVGMPLASEIILSQYPILQYQSPSPDEDQELYLNNALTFFREHNILDNDDCLCLHPMIKDTEKSTVIDEINIISSINPDIKPMLVG